MDEASGDAHGDDDDDDDDDADGGDECEATPPSSAHNAQYMTHSIRYASHSIMQQRQHTSY